MRSDYLLVIRIMNVVLRRNINQIEPYVPGEQPKAYEEFVKLNTNENPTAPSPVVEEAVRNFQAVDLRTYPDPVFSELRRQAALVYGVPRENIFVYYCPNPERSKPLRFVRDQRWKLYGNGRLIDVRNDVLEQYPVTDPETNAIRKQLRAAMDRMPAVGRDPATVGRPHAECSPPA